MLKKKVRKAKGGQEIALADKIKVNLKQFLLYTLALALALPKVYRSLFGTGVPYGRNAANVMPLFRKSCKEKLDEWEVLRFQTAIWGRTFTVIGRFPGKCCRAERSGSTHI